MQDNINSDILNTRTQNKVKLSELSIYISHLAM